MLNITAHTKVSPEEAIGRAVQFFGPDGIGLEIKDQAPTCARFEGGGGGVEVSACAQEKGTSVDIVSQEWEHQVEDFVSSLPR